MKTCDRYLSQFEFFNKLLVDSWCSISESSNHISDHGFKCPEERLWYLEQCVLIICKKKIVFFRSAKSCYRIEETFKLIYRQTQKSPKKKSKSLSHFNSSRDSSIEAGGRSQVSEMQSEDVPLAKLGKKKKRGRKNGERGRKRKAEESDESSERSDDEKIRTEEEEEIYPDEEGLIASRF